MLSSCGVAAAAASAATSPQPAASIAAGELVASLCRVELRVRGEALTKSPQKSHSLIPAPEKSTINEMGSTLCGLDSRRVFHPAP